MADDHIFGPDTARDCEIPLTTQQLKIRPWFCRTQQTVSDDLPKCLGPGHTINNTDVGVCRGQWQWYQLSTVQQHEVPYYVIEQPANGGPAQHVRKTRTETQRHAVAFEVNAGHCPYSYCESGGGPIRDYYTTVDVLVIDGDPTHNWDTAEPWVPLLPQHGNGGSFAQFYRGDWPDEAFRYYKARRRLVGSMGFHVNRTDNCAPKLKDKVNIGIYCSWNPSIKELKIKPCMYSVKVHLIPERVYDGYDAELPIAPSGVQGKDDAVPSYDLMKGLVTNSASSPRRRALCQRPTTT